MQTRSMIEIMIELATGVSVPEDHLKFISSLWEGESEVEIDPIELSIMSIPNVRYPAKADVQIEVLSDCFRPKADIQFKIQDLTPFSFRFKT